jgi:hypothetical protein
MDWGKKLEGKHGKRPEDEEECAGLLKVYNLQC